MGHTVLGKTVTVNYKGKKRRKAEDEELMIFKNTHEAIIDEETWELAHRLRKTIRKPSYPDRPANPLTGLVYCADCGHKLTHRQPSPNKEKIFDADNAYVCGNYRQLTRDCTMHFIKTSALQDLILSDIREVSTFVRSDEKEFLHLVREETNAGIEIVAKEQKKQLHKAEKRIAELNGLIKKLYEGNATGKIPDKRLPSTTMSKAVWNRSFPHYNRLFPHKGRTMKIHRDLLPLSNATPILRSLPRLCSMSL